MKDGYNTADIEHLEDTRVRGTLVITCLTLVGYTGFSKISLNDFPCLGKRFLEYLTFKMEFPILFNKSSIQ